MKVYVIETHLLSGEQAHGVFACRETAQLFMQQAQLHGEPEVLELNVIGDLEQEGEVCTASSYDASRTYSSLRVSMATVKKPNRQLERMA